MKAYDSFVK